MAILLAIVAMLEAGRVLTRAATTIGGAAVPSIRGTIAIHAPVEQVFAVCDSPDAVALFSRGVVAVRDVLQTPERIGDSFTVVYRGPGGQAERRFICTEYEPPRRIAVRFDGETSGTTRCTLDPEDDLTRLTLETTYEAPGGAVGEAVQKLLFEALDERDLDRMLESIKRTLERPAA